jgi:3',5'-cyclic AMP phosphodiesterase CpdA
MEKPPVVIAQVSDFHVTASGRGAYGFDPAVGVERCVTALNAFRPRPSLLIISGDLAEHGSADDYARVRQLLAPLEIPFLVIPGNHDNAEAMRAAFPSQAYTWTEGKLDTATRVHDLEVFALDSAVLGQPYGLLEQRTLDWLDRSLTADTDRPALIFLHHPPFVTGIRQMDRMRLTNAPALGAVLARHPRVRLVAAGHVHRCASTTFAGVRATICPSVNHAVALDLAETMPFSYVLEPPGVHLHCWIEDGARGELVTQLLPLGDYGEPRPF